MKNYDWIENYEGEDFGEFECVGVGSSRRVYALDDDVVVKVAFNDMGYQQSMTEFRIYKNANEEERQVLAQVFDEIRNGYMLLMQRAKLVDREVDDQSLQILEDIIYKYDLLEEDLNSPQSWGEINNELVCIDYGCTKKIRGEYDDNMLKASEED